jgi:hypothetical protein
MRGAILVAVAVTVASAAGSNFLTGNVKNIFSLILALNYYPVKILIKDTFCFTNIITGEILVCLAM